MIQCTRKVSEIQLQVVTLPLPFVVRERLEPRRGKPSSVSSSFCRFEGGAGVVDGPATLSASTLACEVDSGGEEGPSSVENLQKVLVNEQGLLTDPKNLLLAFAITDLAS